MSELPLEGINVLDLSRVLAGPFCSLILSDLGASVIKVEDPLNGDETRSYGPFVGDVSTYFMSVNRNKTSLKIDLKNSKGRKTLYDLVKSSDIVIHNFTPKTEERLGVGFEKLKKLNDKLIYISITGYGREGPAGGIPAYDIDVMKKDFCPLCYADDRVRIGEIAVDCFDPRGRS